MATMVAMTVARQECKLLLGLSMLVAMVIGHHGNDGGNDRNAIDC